MAVKKIQVAGISRAAVLGLVLVALVAVAMVVARRGPSVLAQMTAAQATAQATAESTTQSAPALALAPAPAATRVSAAPAKATGRATQSPKRAAAATPAAKPAIVMASVTTPAVNAPVNAVAQAPDVISLTGCLQHDDGTFQLKDTDGEDAPKSRSWKSGFLKKRSASVEIVDSANRLGLPTHVGQRVTVTGVLQNKEMRARAVQRVGVCS